MPNADMLVYSAVEPSPQSRGVNSNVYEKTQFGLTFTVYCFIIVFEASFTQTQEGAVGVETLSPEAQVVFTALVHI